MREAINVQIEEIIIHILDPEGLGYVPSDIPLPLDGNPQLTDYFTRHIQRSLHDARAKAASFRNINPHQPSGFCNGLLNGQISLVDGSRRLAQSLFTILEGDRRISPADLGVCFYLAENYPQVRFLSILKIDPSQVFRHIVHHDDEGNRYVSFEVEPKAFTNERLQKCAFIQPLVPRHPDYDMILFDRHARGAENGRIARFFSETFLDAEEAFDPRKYTERLYRSLIIAHNSVRQLITPNQDEDLEMRIRNAVTSQRLNLDAWLDELPLPQNIVHQIDLTIRQNIPDREFDLDQSFSERLVQKIRFRGDYNLRLEISADYYRQIVVSEEYISGDPTRPSYHQIILETEEWKKVI